MCASTHAQTANYLIAELLQNISGNGSGKKDTTIMAKRQQHKGRSPKPTGRANKGKRDIWYKLDLSAIVYPTLQRRDFSSVYRLSVVLKEAIDPVLLQTALDRTLPRFPTYKVAIRKGLFWRYLEPNNRPGPYVGRTLRIPVCPCPSRAATAI